MVEGRLKESGLSYTLLRPSYFMEAWLSPADRLRCGERQGTIYGTGENPISWISLGDVAQFAVRTLETSTARNATLELGGPEALTPHQVVRTFEEVGGRRSSWSMSRSRRLKRSSRAATDPMMQSFVGLMRCYAAGDPIDMRETLKVFLVQLTSVGEYARHVYAA